MDAVKTLWWVLLAIAIMLIIGTPFVLWVTRGDSVTAQASRGDASAQYRLGLMYINGDGVPQDYVRALMWFNLSAAQIGEIAVTYGYLVRQSMTSAQIERAGELAVTCKETNYKRCGDEQTSMRASSILVPLKKQAGIYTVPVLINDTITLDFAVDSGAADVFIPFDVVMTLLRTGTVKSTDFTGNQTFTMPDGSTMPSSSFRIRSLRVGDRIVENVTGSVAPASGMLLLGQSFLTRFKSWSVDNTKHALILTP